MPLVALIIGCTFLALGTVVASINFYTSFVRYPLHRWRGGSRADFRWISGFPLVGSLFLWLAVLCLTSQPTLMWTAIIIFLFDTGGPHWFAIMMIYMLLKPRRTDGA
jgi:hypothetical protein